jgi:cullin-4
MDYNAANGFRKNGSNSASGSTSTNPKAPPISGTVAAGPKRLSIKNAKEKHSICSNWDTEWPKLEAAVRAIHECRAYGASAAPSSVERERYHSYEELYRSVENLCTTKLEPMLYTRLHTLCEEYTMRIVSQLHREDLAHDRFLELVNNCWQSHCEKMVRVRFVSCIASLRC